MTQYTTSCTASLYCRCKPRSPRTRLSFLAARRAAHCMQILTLYRIMMPCTARPVLPHCTAGASPNPRGQGSHFWLPEGSAQPCRGRLYCKHCHLTDVPLALYRHIVPQVQAQIPKDKGVIIGCQKGLRSLAAAEQLSRAGYARVAWINGGFDTARPGDLKTSNGRDIRCGWTLQGCGCNSDELT
jgi:rhodanese-related sulfurtransferase